LRAMSVRRMDSLRITSQLQSEWQDSGLSFRIMLVGESGQGKSTFTRALLRPYVPS
jgi:septin family protein